MEETFAKLANRSVVAGDSRSLVDLGYTLANLDDGYQACGAGVDGSFHDAAGRPILDAARFPDVRNMTARARALGIVPGFYANNYICSEPTPEGGVGGARYMQVMSGSVRWLVDNDFGFVKVDSGSCYNDMGLWRSLIAASDPDILIENCHQGGLAPTPTWCPFDWWRVGADVNGEGPDFEIMQVIAALATARPGCLPYPDFMSLDVGQQRNASLFGLYAVMGVPMIMSFDVRDDAQLLPLWETLTNEEVLRVHQDGTAAVGTLLAKFAPHAEGDPEFAWAEDCDPGEPLQQGWAFDSATAQVQWQPSGAAAPLCLASAGLGQSLALSSCSGAAAPAAQRWLLSGERLWQAAPTQTSEARARALSRVGDLALADCAPPAERPGQQWSFTLSNPPVQTNVQSNLTLEGRLGGCWEITACDFSQGADVGTTYGCKGLPQPGDGSACDYNGAWMLNPNGTITSVMSGKCLEVEGDAAGGRVGVSNCTTGQPAPQRWQWGGGAGATTGSIRSASHPTQCIDNGDVPPPPGTTGSCARLVSSWGIEGPALELASPTSNGAPCEAANGPAPEETFALAGGALRVGALCVAGRRGAPSPFGPLQLWAKPVSEGGAAVVLANRAPGGGAAPAVVSVRLDDVPGLAAGAASFELRDVWAKAALGSVPAHGSFNLSAPPGGSMFVVLTPAAAARRDGGHALHAQEAAAAGMPTAQPLSRVVFNESFSNATGAKCLDGTPSGYYIRAGDPRRFVVFLEGGGACYTVDPRAPSSVSCAARAKTALGSSRFWSPTMTDASNVLSSDPSVSAFALWTAVFVPYCGGDVHLGTRTAVVDPAAFPYFFAGHLTVGAVVAQLRAERGLGAAAELLLSGASAGGIGSAMNADFVASLLPGVRVRAAPQAPWFFPPVHNFSQWQSDPNAGPPFFGQDSPLSALWQSYLLPACVAAKGAGFCSSVGFAFPFVATPMHVAQNLDDSNMLFAQLGVPANGSAAARAYAAPYFEDAMRSSLAQVAAAAGGADALWAPACVAHTENLDMLGATRVAGETLKASLDAWYFGGSGVPRVLVDGCEGAGCNPTCPAAREPAPEERERWLLPIG